MCKLAFVSFLFVCGALYVNAAPSALRGLRSVPRPITRCTVRPELVAVHPELKADYEAVCGEIDCAVAMANYCIDAGVSSENAAPPRKMTEDASTPCIARPELIAAHPNLKQDYEALCQESDCAVTWANYCIPMGSSTNEMAPPRKMAETGTTQCIVRPELVAAHPSLKKDYETLCGQRDCAVALSNYCIPVGSSSGEMAPPRKMTEVPQVPCVVRPELVAASPGLKEGYEILCGEADCAVALANYCIPAGARTEEMAPPRKLAEVDAAAPCVVRPELLAAYPRLRSGYETLCAEANCAVALSNYCIPRAEA